jgi:hypothetical protein
MNDFMPHLVRCPFCRKWTAGQLVQWAKMEAEQAMNTTKQ